MNKQLLKYTGISQIIPVWFAIIAIVRHQDILTYYLQGLVIGIILVLIIIFKPGIEGNEK